MKHVQSVHGEMNSSRKSLGMKNPIFLALCLNFKGVYLLSAAEGSLPGQTRCPPGAEWRVSVGC